MAPSEFQLPTLAELRQILVQEGESIIKSLQDRSYDFRGWENDTNRFGPAVHLILRSETAQREVGLGLFVGEVRPVATLMIIRLPRASVMDDLFIEIFAAEHLPDLDSEQFSMDPTKPLREETCRVFKLYAKILAGPALPVIMGEAWEEGHFHDWTLHA